ncbi:MAG: uracil-DNA glycosylase [Bacteroidetes bacterium]|nr:uracil-DNA glycosylase [Bacteroidota bacterium]
MPSKADLFNMYSSRNPDIDRVDAVQARRANLKRYIVERKKMPSLFILAEAPGPWGCRFTGVPITSEEQLIDPAFPHAGERSSLQSDPLKEYSASIYWRVLAPYWEDIFTWNTIPFHPHKIGKPLTIRTPRLGEIKEFVPVLEEIIDELRPARTIAIGRKAERALDLAGVETTYVRHPSQGGALLFEEGVRTIIEEMKLTPTHVR